MLALYSVLVSVTVWLVLLPWGLISVLFGRSTWQDLRERLGHCPAVFGFKEKPRVLFHAVSAGEVNVAGSILKCLLAEQSEMEVVLSTSNRAGKEAGRRLQSLFHQIERVLYLPWDRRRAIGRWLRSLHPDLVCVVETEIWPSLFHACREIGIPLYIVNGRVYGRDVPRYRLVHSLIARTLACADWIGVQSNCEKERFIRIGADPFAVSVVGNAKFDPVGRDGVAEGTGNTPAVSVFGDGRLVIVAASTHRPEERWVLDAYVVLKQEFPDLCLVLAPRDVGTARNIARLVRQIGFRAQLWSQVAESALPHTDVLLLDRMGFLAGLYASADVVFMGGSLVSRGAHNVVEPAIHGKPIVIGPHCYNFADIIGRFTEADALIRLKDRKELHPALRSLLLDPERRRAYGEKGRRVCLAGRGAARLYSDAIRQVLP